MGYVVKGTRKGKKFVSPRVWKTKEKAETAKKRVIKAKKGRFSEHYKQYKNLRVTKIKV